MGVAPGERVALMASNRPEFVAAVQAIWRLGAAVVLISPAWKHDEAEHALAFTDPAHAVGDHPVLAGADADAAPRRADRRLPSRQRAPRRGARAPTRCWCSVPAPPACPRRSGTPTRQLDAAVRHWRDALQLTRRDRIQITTPPSHILGLLNIVTALRTGTWMRLHRRFDLDGMLHHIEADRITVEMAVAPIALAMASHPELESYDLSSLRYIMWGATPVTPSIAETVTRRTGVGWVPAYGSHGTAGHRLQPARRGPARHRRARRAGRATCEWCRWRPANRSGRGRSARSRPGRTR